MIDYLNLIDDLICIVNSLLNYSSYHCLSVDCRETANDDCSEKHLEDYMDADGLTILSGHSQEKFQKA